MVVISANRKWQDDPIRTELEKMAVSDGEKVGHYFIADFTVKDVLDRVGQTNTDINQNYIRYKVAQLYPKSEIRPGQGDNGGFIHLLVWSK